MENQNTRLAWPGRFAVILSRYTPSLIWVAEMAGLGHNPGMSYLVLLLLSPLLPWVRRNVGISSSGLSGQCALRLWHDEGFGTFR